MSRTFRGRITRRLSVMVVASLVLWALMPGIALAHNDNDNDNDDRGGNHGDNDDRDHRGDNDRGVIFRARLSPGEEVQTPAVVSDGEGEATFRLEGSTVSFKLKWEDLTTGTTAGHIHCAADGVNGAVGVTLLHDPMGTDGRVRGSFTAPDPSAAAACGWTDLGDVLGDMLTGKAYVNVHTTMFPGGEIRGQVEQVGKLKFEAELSPGEEVQTPAVVSDGEGEATFRLEGSTVSFKLKWEDLTTGTTAGHIHCAADGVNGAVGVTLLHDPMGTDGRVRGSFTAPDPSAAAACGWTDLGDVLGDMLTGKAYVNVHTTMFPGGEIRGQIERD